MVTTSAGDRIVRATKPIIYLNYSSEKGKIETMCIKVNFKISLPKWVQENSQCPGLRKNGIGLLMEYMSMKMFTLPFSKMI